MFTGISLPSLILKTRRIAYEPPCDGPVAGATRRWPLGELEVFQELWLLGCLDVGEKLCCWMWAGRRGLPVGAGGCKRGLIPLGGKELSEMHAGYGNSFGFLCAVEADDG